MLDFFFQTNLGKTGKEIIKTEHFLNENETMNYHFLYLVQKILNFDYT